MSWTQIQKAFDFATIVENIKWKRCDAHILMLQKLPSAVTTESRKNVIDKRFAKFRASGNSLVPLKIYNTDYDRWETKIEHKCGVYHIVYEVGVAVSPHDFHPNIDVICAPGIHFFNSLVAAFFYTITRKAQDIEFGDGGEVRKVQYTNTETVSSCSAWRNESIFFKNFTTICLSTSI